MITPLTEMVLEAEGVGELVDTLFLKTLGRRPDPAEGQAYQSLLQKDSTRGLSQKTNAFPLLLENAILMFPGRITFSRGRTRSRRAIARDIEVGSSPTRALQSEWRMNFEDGLWALINSPEMIFVP